MKIFKAPESQPHQESMRAGIRVRKYRPGNFEHTGQGSPRLIRRNQGREKRVAA